jgi:hypothetical protein
VPEPQDPLGGPPPLSLDEAQRIIARLEEVVRKQRVVLIGGQAVSIWIGQLHNRLTDPLIAEPIVRFYWPSVLSARLRFDQIATKIATKLGASCGGSIEA